MRARRATSGRTLQRRPLTCQAGRPLLPRAACLTLPPASSPISLLLSRAFSVVLSPPLFGCPSRRLTASCLSSPRRKPADPSLASASAAPVKAVYVRRKDASTSSTPSASIAPASASSTAVAAAGQVKAVYERPAGATVTAAPARATKNKKNKARGVMPFTKDEKRERLPAKIFSAFGEFATLEAASHAAIFNVPHHTVLPAKNLPPPNESAQHGFWPGPPNRKDALKKAIFPAPPEPLEDVDDDRPRVEVFIDNSNVLYSFLNWVRARPEAKITSTKIGAQKGKDGKPQPAKTIKTVTIAGKKVKLDYKMLFALLERGRRVERRVLVGSSALWQSLEPAVEWVSWRPSFRFSSQPLMFGRRFCRATRSRFSSAFREPSPRLRPRTPSPLPLKPPSSQKAARSASRETRRPRLRRLSRSLRRRRPSTTRSRWVALVHDVDFWVLTRVAVAGRRRARPPQDPRVAPRL